MSQRLDLRQNTAQFLRESVHILVYSESVHILIYSESVHILVYSESVHILVYSGLRSCQYYLRLAILNFSAPIPQKLDQFGLKNNVHMKNTHTPKILMLL